MILRGAARALPLSAALLGGAAQPAAAQPATAQPAPAQPYEPSPPPSVAYVTSPEDRLYRVAFDPQSRVWLGVAGAMDRGVSGVPVAMGDTPKPPGPRPAFEVDAGLGWRNRSAQGEGKDRITWQVDHRVIAGWVQPMPRADGVVPFDAALYGVSMLRHDATPSIVMPTSPPVGIPFPFDIGLDAEVGRVTTLAYPSLRALRFGVARGAITLDPWRSGMPGRSFEIGLGARYDLDAVPGAAPGVTAVVHRVAPMTAGSVRFRYQTADGITVVDCRGDVVPHYSSEGAWRLLALSSLHVERALIALADQPVAAVLEGGYRYDPKRTDAEAVSDFRVSLGLTMNLTLR